MSSNTVQQLDEAPAVQQKRERGGQEANKNASKHELSIARRALNRFGSRAIDRRSALGRALARFKAEIVADLGGVAALSAQQRAILDVLIRTKLMLDSIDVYILSQRSLVDRRKRAILPVIRERAALANTFVEHLTLLGLKRVPPPVPTLSEFVRDFDSKRAQSQRSSDSGMPA